MLDFVTLKPESQPFRKSLTDMAEMTKKDIQRLRQVFSKAESSVKFGDGEVVCEADGDQLEILLSPSRGQTIVLVPCNENGDFVRLIVNNSVLKRWKNEATCALQLMRRAATGESGTAVQEHQYR